MFRFLFLLLICVLPLRADPAADALVQQMAARDQVLARDRASWSYAITETREKLDSTGKVFATTMEKTEAHGSPAIPATSVPGQGMEASLQQASREEPFNILQILSHYQFTMEPDDVWNGVPCHKVHFTPRGNQPHRNRDEKVANELEGDMWIACDDATLLHHVGHLTKPVSVAWFFASVHELDFSFDTLRLPNGEWAPSRVQYRFRVELPFFQIHERHTRATTDYHLTP